MTIGINRGYGRGDRDHDGIPDRVGRDRDGDGDGDGDGVLNRFDNKPNISQRKGQRYLGRDGIPNRVDRDRDGDGVRNRQDSNPNNPRRN